MNHLLKKRINRSIVYILNMGNKVVESGDYDNLFKVYCQSIVELIKYVKQETNNVDILSIIDEFKTFKIKRFNFFRLLSYEDNFDGGGVGIDPNPGAVEYINRNKEILKKLESCLSPPMPID